MRASKNLITRLVIAAVIFQILLISGGSFFALDFGKDWLRNDFAKKTQSMTDTLAQLASPFLCLNQVENLKETFQTHLAQGEIEYILLRKNNENIISLGQIPLSVNEEHLDQNLKDKFESSKIYTTFGTATDCNDSASEAEIEVGFNFSSLLEPLNLSKRIILAGTLIEFFAIFIIFLMARKMVSKRLAAIEEKCRLVAKGDFDSTLELSGGDEFARISKSINDMSFSLKKLNKETDEARHQLLAQAKLSSIGEMAAGIAHEVNNPLAIVSGRLEQITRHLQSSPPQIQKAIETTEKTFHAVHRASQIIRGLKLLSRNSESDPLVETPLDEVLKDALSLTTDKTRAHGVEMQVNIPEGILIQCRPGQISQVLINLINNSADAIENRTDKWIKINAVVVEEKVRISVTDSGEGIPPAILAKLMEPFFTTKPVGKGTGLGLSISRGILEGHNGRLEYDNTSPNTSFFLELPLSPNQILPKAA